MPEAHTPVGAERPTLPPELAEALVDLLAQALVAELMESHKAAETLPTPDVTGTSPPGHVRTTGDSFAPAT